MITRFGCIQSCARMKEGAFPWFSRAKEERRSPRGTSSKEFTKAIQDNRGDELIA